MEDNENKIFEENTYWPQTLGDEAVGKKIDILHTSNPTETASVIAEKEKKIYDRPAEAFKILPEDLSEVYVGTETQLELVPVVDEGDEAPNAPTVVWESSNLDVAFVGDGNILGALSEGSATIKATDINNPDVAPVSKEVTVLVFGKKYTFTVTFSDGANVISTVSGKVGAPVELPTNLEKEGYTFKGWSIDGETVILPVSQFVEEDITYVALWEEVPTYTITFKDGETTISSVSGAAGTPVSTPGEMEKEGYTFSGWSLDGKNVTMPVSNIGDSSVTYFAVWAEVVPDGPAAEYFNVTILSAGIYDDVPMFYPYEPDEYQYSLDKETWEAFNDPIEVSDGDVIYLRATETRSTIGKPFSSKTYTQATSGDARYKIAGNILSLMYSDNSFYNAHLETCPDFSHMFAFDGYIVDASELILPNIASSYSYSEMFSCCSRLTAAPAVLPATTLAEWCYYGMFSACQSLVSAPTILATTLAANCFTDMFLDCSSLVNAPSLPVTTLAANCYDGMFKGCTSLESAPELPALTLVSECYKEMFYGCTALSYIKCLATSGINSGTTGNWVYNLPSYGTFVVNENTTYDNLQWTEGYDGIPYSWYIELPDGSNLPGGESFTTS